jgi:hypothetical protein
MKEKILLFEDDAALSKLQRFPAFGGRDAASASVFGANGYSF